MSSRACLLQIVILIWKISLILKSQLISHFTLPFFFFRETKRNVFPIIAAESGAELTTGFRRYVTKADVRDKPPSAARIAALLEFKMARPFSFRSMLKRHVTRLIINSFLLGVTRLRRSFGSPSNKHRLCKTLLWTSNSDHNDQHERISGPSNFTVVHEGFTSAITHPSAKEIPGLRPPTRMTVSQVASFRPNLPGH